MVSSSALVVDTAPKPFQVTPSVEYCQVPLPLFEVIAMPFCAPLSTSAQVAPLRMVLTVVPDDVLSSSVAVSVTVAALVMVGASLTAVTDIEAVAAELE